MKLHHLSLSPLTNSMPIIGLCGDQCRRGQYVAAVYTGHHQRFDLHKNPAGEGRGRLSSLSQVAPTSRRQYFGSVSDQTSRPDSIR